MKYAILAGLLLALPAAAQPEQAMPTTSTPVEDVLAASRHLDISNGLITARVAPPDLTRGFYRGTRFDQAGVVTSLIFKGRDFYGPWFDRVAPEVLDYAYDAQGRVVEKLMVGFYNPVNAPNRAAAGFFS